MTEKLSHAIRAGAAITQPVEQVFLKEDPRTMKITHTCALGAAYIGMEGADAGFRQLGGWLVEQWPILNDTWENPVTHKEQTFDMLIYDLNDIQHWSREQIADWLEQEGL